MSLKIITTEDGSNSLFDEELNETYHSTRGARGESQHVFIKEGLEYWLNTHEAKEIRILEIGLGTGLNAFLTALFASEHQQKIHFTSLEPYPVEKDIYQKLNYHRSGEEQQLFLEIHHSVWEQDMTLSAYFEQRKLRIQLEHLDTNELFNLIYFDAFAPSKQPEVWSLANLKKCYGLLNDRGILTTYCAQGQFKRNLVEAGFEVETLQGAMGKKEMVRAIKPS